METKKSTIIDVGGQIEDFREMVRTFMLKTREMNLKSEKSDSEKDFIRLISGCERLFRTLEKSNPEKLADKDLFSLWESLFCLDQIRQLPGGGTKMNLEMLKIASTDRISAFFADHQIHTIGVDERVDDRKNGTASMVLDVILEDSGSNKLNNVGLPKEFISIHRKYGGIFITIGAEDVPKLLATGSKKDELFAERKQTHGKVSGAISKMN